MSIKAVLAKLQECLIIDQLASHVFLSAPFNLDPQHSVEKYVQALKDAAEDAGASFIPIKWLAEHGEKETPLRRLNVVGKKVLVDSFLQAANCPSR